MNWNDLRYLLVATREPNLSAAARKLGVNQTTVSRRLHRLEEDLRVRLFDHTPRGLALTPAGDAVLAAAASVDEAVSSLDRTIAGGDTKLEGPLRITTIELVAAYDVELFQTFSRRYPGIALELAVSDRHLNLTKREADVALRFAVAPPEQLIARRMARIEYSAYAAPSLTEKRKSRASLESLPWLAWDESKGARGTEAWMRKHVPNATIVCRFDSAVAMHAAARAGVGAAVLSCAYAAVDGSLQQLVARPQELAWDLWLLMHPDLRKNGRVRAFADHAAQYYTSTPRFALTG